MKRLFGAVLAAVGLVAVALGVLGAVAFGVDGRLTASSSALVSDKDSYALVADVLSINAGFPGSSSLGEVTIGAEAVGGKPLFIGYATRAAVDSYLEGVGFDAVAQNGSAWQTKSVPGGPPPDAPEEEDLWIASSDGFDAEVTFAIPSSGQASVVVMNMDGGAPVKAKITVGYQSDLVFPLSVGLIAAGVVALALGLWSLRPRKAERRSPPPAAAAPGPASGEQEPSASGPAPAGSTAGEPEGSAAGAPAGSAAGEPEGSAAGESVPQDWFRQDTPGR